MSTNAFLDNPFSAGINEIRSYWGRFLALGIVTMALGVVCILYCNIATQASEWVLGLLLFISGIVCLIQAFWVRNWSGFFLFFLSALLQGFVGYLLVRYPHAGTVALTMVLAAFFIVGGIFRLVVAGLLKFPTWLWAMLSGVMSLALGILVLARMHEASVFFLGLVIGVSFLMDGAWFIALSADLHKIPQITVSKPKAA